MLKQFLDRVWSGGTSPHDSELYAIVHQELSSGRMDAGLWTKATAISDGNTEKAKSRYIEMRVNALRAERKSMKEFARQIQNEQQRIENTHAQAEGERRRLEEIKRQLLTREKALSRSLWEKFTSPAAVQRIMKRRRVSATMLLAAILILFWLVDDKPASLNNLLFALIGFGLPLALIWVLINAHWGRTELKSQLDRVRKELSSTQQ